MIGETFLPIHGGSDGGPEPRYDFSTNANALGPDPFALSAVRQADPTRYPDPLYTELHREIAAYHNLCPEQVAVGSGSSELIHRLTRLHRSGSVLTLIPTFTEYARAARLAQRPLMQTRQIGEFLRLLPTASLVFVCMPNNPTGESFSFLEEAAQRAEKNHVTLVLDLAYHPLMQEPPPLPQSVWRLYSPNKAHGLTGVRAAYLLAPDDLTEFRHHAPSWVLDTHGEALLRAVLQANSRQWLATTRQTLWSWRSMFAEGLRQLGLEVWEGCANFLMVRVRQATIMTQALRKLGIRVRDCSSFGLPEWLRLCAQSPEAQAALFAALQSLLPSTVNR